MKNIIVLSFIGCLLIFSSCEDETINNMESINDQWTDANSEIKNAEQVIQKILLKYNATSYKVLDLSIDDPAQAAIKLFDNGQNVVERILADDKTKMATAISVVRASAKEMAQLKDVDEVFSVVEEPPTPKGGMGEYFEYIGQNLMYPKQAREMGIEGKVYVEFVINDFGEITNVKVLKGIGAGCDEAAKKVVQNSKPWQPGKQKGEAVKVKMVLPVTFKLTGKAG